MKLFYMGNVNQMEAQQITEAEKLISEAGYAVIATNNSMTGARVSALAILQGSNIKELCFMTDTTSAKTKNLLLHPLCELFITDGEGQVILRGNARVLTDMETKKSKWQDWMLGYFPKGVEDENLCIVKFITDEVRAMIE